MHSFITVALALAAAVSPIAAAPTPGCGKNPPSSGTKSITVSGRQRQYILQLPGSYNSSSAHRLVFGYHWRDGSMNDVANGGFYSLRPLAGNSAIFVAPNGFNRGWANNGGEDIAFTDAILASLKNDLCIDDGQIFATGWSYGGAMSHSVACARPNVFKAVSVIAGALLSGCSGGTTPVAYLGIHGSSDNVLPIAMGRQLRDKWIGTNGCQSKNAPDVPSGQQNHIKTTFTCSKAAVTWIGHGGGHVPDPSGANGVKFAPQETWNFFNAAVGGSNPSPNPNPNPDPEPQPNPDPSPNPSCAPRWAQCGGQGWTGATCCESGSTCTASNQYYSQCI